MARTTLDIDGSVLSEVRALRAKEGRSMGQIVSELLAEALAQRKGSCEVPRFAWVSRPMRALVDLSDHETLYTALDRISHS